MKKMIREIYKKIKESRVVTRKTYRKYTWNKKIIIAFFLILIIAIVVSFLLKCRKNRGSYSIEETKPIEIKIEGKVVRENNLDEILPDNPEVISQGIFESVEQKLQGKALFLKSGEKIFLRLENFHSVNGQDMHVYLSPVLKLNPEDAIDAGILKATSGDMNYKLGSDINLDKYNNVLIWSNRFDAFFGYATLQEEELPPAQEEQVQTEETLIEENMEEAVL